MRHAPAPGPADKRRTAVYSRAQIERVIEPKQVIAAMERAFVAYSNGEAIIPPVGQLDFENPPAIATSSTAI